IHGPVAHIIAAQRRASSSLASGRISSMINLPARAGSSRTSRLGSRRYYHVVMSNRPASSEGHYIDLVPEEDVISALEAQTRETEKLLRSITEEKAKFR